MYILKSSQAFLKSKYTLTFRMKRLRQFNPSAFIPLPLSSKAPRGMRFIRSTLFSRCCEGLFVESSAHCCILWLQQQGQFCCQVHFVSREASTQQGSTAGQFVRPHALFMSRCWQSAICNSLSPSWSPSFVNGTYLYETVSLRSVSEGPLIIRTQDVLCRGRRTGGATSRPHTRRNLFSNSKFDMSRQKNCTMLTFIFPFRHFKLSAFITF